MCPLLLTAISLIAQVSQDAGATDPPDRAKPPTLTGRLLFHRYRAYDAWDSEIYLADFARKSLVCLSMNWPVDHAMNAQFSPDGKRVVFMAVPKREHERSRWDIYLSDIGARTAPRNLTIGNGLCDEDPKFSPDGKTIVFKRDGRVAFMDLNGKHGRLLAGLEPGVEYSMPVLIANGKRVVAMTGARADGDLYSFAVPGGSRSPVAVTPGVLEYYPVPWTADYLLYVRWQSAEIHNDQIYRHTWRDGMATPVRFSRPDTNNSDPCPVDDRWIIFSSTRGGGKGGYDLYLGDSRAGGVRALYFPEMNTSLEELGACYQEARPGK
jgi:Tol biopolymer transport system component